MFSPNFHSVRFGGLPESYWQARREAPRRREILADSSNNLEKPVERVFRDLLASIMYRSRVETKLERALVDSDIERCETVLAHKIDQMGPDSTRMTRYRQRAFLKEVEDAIQGMPDALYKAPPVLANALLGALDRLESTGPNKPRG